MRETSLKPPVLKRAINDANQRVWSGKPLGTHITDIERLLMISAETPVALDALPLRGVAQRSTVLVDELTKLLRSDAAMKPMVQRLGASLMADRQERLNVPISSAPDIKESITSITRNVVVKPSYRSYG